MTENDARGDAPAVRVRSREHDLARTFVALADTLVADYDVVDLLDRLVGACVALLGVTAAGLLLDDQKGHLALIASSSEGTRLLEIFQLQKNEGPCLDCARTGTAVTSADLELDRDRWPVFVPEALAAGFRSVTALPLRLRDQTLGGLNMFSDTATLLASDDRDVAQALADVATIGVLQQRSAHRTTVLAEQLQHALNSRIVIEQAKGVLAERDHVPMEDAFATLRKHARDHNLKLSDVAFNVVRGSSEPGATPPPLPQAGSAETFARATPPG
jgi:transcriptional regulator with GAF, ATPase, and Fis domain